MSSSEIVASIFGQFEDFLRKVGKMDIFDTLVYNYRLKPILISLSPEFTDLFGKLLERLIELKSILLQWNSIQDFTLLSLPSSPFDASSPLFIQNSSPDLVDLVSSFSASGSLNYGSSDYANISLNGNYTNGSVIHPGIPPVSGVEGTGVNVYTELCPPHNVYSGENIIQGDVNTNNPLMVSQNLIQIGADSTDLLTHDFVQVGENPTYPNPIIENPDMPDSLENLPPEPPAITEKLMEENPNVIQADQSILTQPITTATVSKEKSKSGGTKPKKKYLCQTCGKMYSTSQALSAHMNVHTKVREFPCKFCSKVFSRKDKMIFHESTHTGVKSFICEVCGKGFSRKVKLDEHLRRHRGLKKYSCTMCGKFYASNRDLRRHLKKHSSNPDAPPIVEQNGEPASQEEETQDEDEKITNEVTEIFNRNWPQLSLSLDLQSAEFIPNNDPTSVVDNPPGL